MNLRPKSFALLSYFADHPGRVVSKEELLAAVWPGVVVTDDSLSQCVNELRAALGDREQRLIKTVPRRGYLFDAAVSEARPGTESAPPVRTTARAARWLPWAGAALAIAFLAGGLAWLREPPFSVDEAVWARRSIAVMPFADQSDDKRAYFAEAVTEDLIADIARLPQTRVIARASAAAVGARETDIRTIGRELGVRYVLTGSVRREGAAVRINAQLASSERGVVLWSEQFDYPSATDWAWQRDIGLRIARTLDLRLTAANAAPPARGDKLEVIDAVMQGAYLARHSGSRADQLRARAHFEAALAIDPNSLVALSGLALAHLSAVQSRMSEEPEQQIALAAQAIDRALSIDPNFTTAHYARGHLQFVRGDLEGALREYQTVLARNPSDAWAHARIGSVMLNFGRLEEVAPHIAAAKRLNPLEGLQVSFGHFIDGMAEFHLGRVEAAHDHMRQAVAANPNLIQAWAWLAALDTLQGRDAQAQEALEELRRRRPNMTLRALRGYQGERPTPVRLRPGSQRIIDAIRKAGLPD